MPVGRHVFLLPRAMARGGAALVLSAAVLVGLSTTGDAAVAPAATTVLHTCKVILTSPSNTHRQGVVCADITTTSLGELGTDIRGQNEVFCQNDSIPVGTAGHYVRCGGIIEEPVTAIPGDTTRKGSIQICGIDGHSLCTATGRDIHSAPAYRVVGNSDGVFCPVWGETVRTTIDLDGVSGFIDVLATSHYEPLC